MLRAMIVRSALLKVTPIPPRVIIRNRSITEYRCDAHMNELPIPCLPWAVGYSKMQTWYSIWFVIGLLSFSMSVYAMIQSKCLRLELWNAPCEPGPPSAEYAEKR